MIAVEFVAFVGKGLHIQDALQGFLDDRGRVGEAILRFTGNLARLAAENHGCHDNDGKAGEHDARQLQRGDGDQGDPADQDGGLAKKLGQDGDQGVFNLNQVAGKPAGQLAHAALREKRHGQRDQSGVGVAAQIDQAALPGGGKGKGLEEGEARLHRQDAHQQERRPVRARHAAAAFGVLHGSVEDAPRQVRERQTQQAGDKQGCQGGAEPAPVGTQIPEQLQRLLEIFPIQLRLREVDPRLVIA